MEPRSPTLLTSPIPTTSTKAKGGTAERHLDPPPQTPFVTGHPDLDIDAPVLVTQDLIARTSLSHVMTGSDSAPTLPTHIIDRTFTPLPILVTSLPCLSCDPTIIAQSVTGRSHSLDMEKTPDSEIRPLKRKRLTSDDGRSDKTQLIGSTSTKRIRCQTCAPDFCHLPGWDKVVSAMHVCLGDVLRLCGSLYSSDAICLPPGPNGLTVIPCPNRTFHTRPSIRPRRLRAHQTR